MQAKNTSRFFLMKFVLLFFFLVFLSIILFVIISFEDPFFDPSITNLKIVLISLVTPILISVIIFAALTIKEYQSYFTRRTYIKEGRSYLTLTDIFENKNRVKILTQILNNPGIHHNELLRSCDLQTGQLQWHLDTLLKHKIIKKEKYGQYTIYFPISSSKDEIFKNQIAKSKTTSSILKIIKENPGTNSSEIARTLNLSRSTIKYHIDKLSEDNLIKLVKNGRKYEIYSN